MAKLVGDGISEQRGGVHPGGMCHARDPIDIDRREYSGARARIHEGISQGQLFPV
jgi:hypothetical protein